MCMLLYFLEASGYLNFLQDNKSIYSYLLSTVLQHLPNVTDLTLGAVGSGKRQWRRTVGMWNETLGKSQNTVGIKQTVGELRETVNRTVGQWQKTVGQYSTVFSPVYAC